MAKTKISEFSSTPANNTDIDSINIAEGCAPSNINDAIRELMAQLKDFQTGAVGDSFNGPIGTSTAAAGAFTTLSASSTTTLSGLTASTALALDASKNVVSVTNTGSGSNVLATSPTLVTPALGTPSSATLTNATGLPISTGVSGLGTGVATALAVNVGSAGAPVVNGGALGTPSSGTVTNLTGTASININGTVGATTPTTGAFTTVAASSDVTLSGGTANGVTYLNGSKVLTSGSALTFDGTNLGVGGTSGGARLHVITTNPSISTIESSSAVGGYQTFSNSSSAPLYVGFGATLITGLSTSDAALRYSNNLVFGYGASEVMRLTSTSLYTASGINVGIGTSSPSQKLEVAGAAKLTGTNLQIAPSTTTSAAYLLNTNGGGNFFFGIDNSTGSSFTGTAYARTIYSGGAYPLVFLTNDLERMRLDASGSLGLGVTPSASWANYKVLQIGEQGVISGYASGAGVLNTGANFYWDGSGYRYLTTNPASLYQQNAGAHNWRIAASGTAGDAISFTQALTLDASGNLGLGATSITPRDSGARTLELYGTTSGRAAIKFTNATSGTGATDGMFLGYDDNLNFSIVNNESGVITFGTNNTERARIPSTGGIQSVNSISVGNVAPTTSGAGITFPATQSASSDANTLDDYEEGTWTSSLTVTASTSGTITVSDKGGTYTKIGNIVTVQGYFNVASVSSPVGDLRIGGLPFTISSSYGIGSASLQPYGFGTTSTVTAYYGLQISNQTYFVIRGFNNGAQVTTVANNVQADTGMQFTVTYQV